MNAILFFVKEKNMVERSTVPRFLHLQKGNMYLYGYENPKTGKWEDLEGYTAESLGFEIRNTWEWAEKAYQDGDRLYLLSMPLPLPSEYKEQKSVRFVLVWEKEKK